MVQGLGCRVGVLECISTEMYLPPFCICVVMLWKPSGVAFCDHELGNPATADF